MDHKEPDELSDEEIRRIVMRAFKHLMDRAKSEPSVFVVSGGGDSEPDCPVDEITAWLFQRRQENGRRDN